MDNETAKLLFEEGATLIFLDAPEGIEFGIDYTSWNVGPKFKGMKMIPPGIHYVYYSMANKQGPSPRSSFFYNFTRGEILVKKWDRRAEDLSSEPVDPEEIERISCNKKELDTFLGPYPYEKNAYAVNEVRRVAFDKAKDVLSLEPVIAYDTPGNRSAYLRTYKSWVSLSSHLSWPLVERLLPVQGRISAVTEFVSEPSNSQSRMNKMQTEELSLPVRGRLPEMEIAAGTQLRFTSLQHRGYPEGSTPSQITQHSMDSTFTLENTLTTYDNETDILGEIQFAFICFLIGQVGDAFDQWKKLVHLLCSSDVAVRTKPNLYVQFIGVLFYHLKEIPEDFFVDIVSNDNFLVRTLHGLFLALENDGTDPGLRRRGLQFRNHLTKRFKWDFTEEPSDEAPVVVDLSGYTNE